TTNSAATTGYYMNDTQVSIKTNAAGQQVYTYTKLYHLNSGELVTREVVGGLKGYNDWTSALTGVKPIGAIYAEKNGEYRLLTPIDTTSTNTGLANGYPSAKYSRYILEALLGTGYTDADGVFYDKVYATKGEIGTAAATVPYYVPFKGLTAAQSFTDAACYDSMTKALDLIYYDYTGNAVTKIIVNANGISTDKDDSDSKDLLGGNAYYKWTKNTAFTGVVVKGEEGPNQAEDQAAAIAALADKYVANLTAVPNYNKDLDCACGGRHTLGDHVAAYKAEYIKLVTDEAMAAQNALDVPYWTNIVATAKSNADKAASDAVKKAIDDAKADLLTEYNKLSNKSEKAVADAYSAGITAIEGAKTAAAVTTAYNTALANIKAADKKVTDDAAAAAAKGVVKAENTATATVLTLQNVSDITFSGVEIFTVGANGLATKVATVTLGATYTYADTATRNDVTVEWVRTGMNGVLTLKVTDRFNVSTPVLAAGTYKFITTGDVIASGPITIG
ncbi:MAG: hypothetical protein IKD37_08935, partial [Clostridia bacterium]|nr:hypothetical protein [Clostridia bacterium]